MNTATHSKTTGLELRGYDFMDLMRDAGMIPSKAPRAFKPAPTLADFVARAKALHRDWTYDFMDLVKEFGQVAAQPGFAPALAATPVPLAPHATSAQPSLPDLPHAA
ncbi:MAG: hypothetical protein D6782_05615 [Alphaproteobacteria bacterium]|nr:MAG: hypothetical protein D6782_05615 [Alphaproteobacteria bacterium]